MRKNMTRGESDDRDNGGYGRSTKAMSLGLWTVAQVGGINHIPTFLCVVKAQSR